MKAFVSVGLQVFADKVGLSVQNVSDFFNKRRKFSTGVIDK